MINIGHENPFPSMLEKATVPSCGRKQLDELLPFLVPEYLTSTVTFLSGGVMQVASARAVGGMRSSAC